MKDYGLDGVFMQRFWGAAKPDARKRSHVLANAMEAARKYDRAIGVMYDLSGLNPATDNCSMLVDDWKYLVDSLRVTNPDGDNTYVFYNGKPLVTIWGVGHADKLNLLAYRRIVGALKYSGALVDLVKHGHIQHRGAGIERRVYLLPVEASPTCMNSLPSATLFCRGWFSDSLRCCIMIWTAIAT